MNTTPRSGLPAWAEWHTDGQAYSLGLEEEVMLLEPDRGFAPAQRVEEVLAVLPAELRAYVSQETHRAAVELRSDPHSKVAAAGAQLRGQRAQLGAALAPLGLGAAAAGVHPFTEWSSVRISEGERYRLIHEAMRDLALREPTYALHVHVGVTDPEQAIRLMNRLRVHVPLLLALSANSPYWRARDSGLASARTFIFGVFPRTGLPRRYDGYPAWVEAVDLQVRAGALPESTHLWWDIRPQPALGTVEVRVMDVQSRCADTEALAALVQSIVRLELEEGYAPEAATGTEEALAENRFLAARDGAAARFLDPVTGKLRPVQELLSDLVGAAEPHAADLGCLEELRSVAALCRHPGAAWQRERVAGGADLPGLLDALVQEFTKTS